LVAAVFVAFGFCLAMGYGITEVAFLEAGHGGEDLVNACFILRKCAAYALLQVNRLSVHMIIQ
jgi:hypothetical protein